MEGYKFLGTINGIYNFPADADFNIWTTLLVYINPDRKKLLIKEHSLYLEGGQESVKDCEDVLYMSAPQLELIYNNFCEQMIKEFIFNSYLDCQLRTRRYAKIF